MNDRQKRFVNEYLIDLNGSQAAVRAGYSQKTARTIASSLLRREDIAEEIKTAMSRREERTQVSQDKVIDEIAKIAFADISDFVKVKSRRAQGGGSGDFLEEAAGCADDKYLQVVETSLLNGEQTAAIASLKETRYGISVELYDKMKALNMLGQHMGMFSSKTGALDEEDTQSLAEVIKRAYAQRKESGELDD